MRTIIDGYNVTKSDPATSQLSLENQRSLLLLRLRSHAAELGCPGTACVVFDGESGTHPTPSIGPLRVLFSQDEPADDLIVELARTSNDEITLVSSDRELCERVKVVSLEPVTIRGASELFQSAVAKGRKRKREGVSRDAGLPPGARKITKELEDLWLD